MEGGNVWKNIKFFTNFYRKCFGTVVAYSHYFFLLKVDFRKQQDYIKPDNNRYRVYYFYFDNNQSKVLLISWMCENCVGWEIAQGNCVIKPDYAD